MGKSAQVRERVRKVGEIDLQIRPQPKLPNTTIDLNKLENTQISKTILQRGMNLKALGRVHPAPLYPWKFLVSGDNSINGTSLYSVDLAEHECSCMWFINTGTTCKHLVAALLVYIENQNQSQANPPV